MTEDFASFLKCNGWKENLDPVNKWTFVSRANSEHRKVLDRFIGSKNLMTGAMVCIHKTQIESKNDHWPVSITWRKRLHKPTTAMPFPDWIFELPDVAATMGNMALQSATYKEAKNA